MNSSPAQEPADSDVPQLQDLRPPRSPEHERLHVSFKDDRRYLEQMIALDNSKRAKRVEAIKSLKESLEKTSSAIQSRNARRNRKEQEIRDQDAERFDELLSQGLNPYEVARKRPVREIADSERKKIENNTQEKQVAILKHLEIEKVWMQRQERVAAEQRAFEKKYQKEMGRTAMEERTKQYLVSRTGRETMDPTGKAFRLYPSQETSIKDRSFGLGKNLVHDADQRHKIVDKVHRKRVHHHSKDAEPNPMLLPRLVERGMNNNDADGRTTPPVQLCSEAAITPGQDLEQLNHSVVAKAPLPPLTRNDTEVNSVGVSPTLKKGFGKPHRSVLEQRMLDQAREKQKNNIFQKQIVWGKEFTGRAFLADPPEIWFKDFDVGVPMTLSFTLTNVSNTFNHFKVLDLEESIREHFDIKFEKPGRMSAGMSCRITITFTAMLARDIDSVLPAVAQTGPFSVPLRCTCKKAVPVMTIRSLVFEDVVVGEKQVLSLKLENHGVLPFEFEVVRVEKDGGEPRPELDDDDGHGSETSGSLEVVGSGDTHSEEASQEDDARATANASSSSPGRDAAGSRAECLLENDIPANDELYEDDLPNQESNVGTFSSSSSAESIAAATSSVLVSQHLALRVEEERILTHARASIVYNPEGADIPVRHTSNGTVAPYGSTSVTFTFAPASPMDIDEQFLVKFPDSTASFRTAFWAPHLLTPIPISVSARSTQVPIFIEQPELDFRCCLYDRLYRHQLVVCNRGTVALKLQIRVPKALDGSVEFHPNMGFVQGASATGDTGKFPVQIKFRPNTEMWKRLQTKSLGDESLGFLAVPVQIVVPDQVVPVYCILYAQISPTVLSFSPRRLDFGACVLGHSVTHMLRITNTSRLPQQIAFVRLSPEVRLENPHTSANTADDGIVTLFPSEEKSFRVVYQPNASTTTLSSRLVCRSTTIDEYSIPIAGECVASPLSFSHSVVRLAATQLGQIQVFSILCKNNSDRPQTMELVVPHEATNCLRVTPTVATVGSRTSVRVEIEFRAHELLFDIQSGEYPARGREESLMPTPVRSVFLNASCDKATKLDSNLIAVSGGFPSRPPWFDTNGIPAEERSVHHTWSILCFRQQPTAAPVSGSLVAFQVQTTAIEPKLFATPKELDFGQVAIGQALVRELHFTNNSPLDVVLSAKPLHALGGFRMINSSQRPIVGCGGNRMVKMEFRPTTPLLYDDELELFCPELGVIRVGLRGEGVNPSLRIQPEDGVLDFRDVLARNRATSELLLTNSSAFPLSLAIVPLLEEASTVPITTSGLPVFTFSPSEATIPARTTITVKVLFYPDHQRPQHYCQQYRIKVPNESERHVLTLSGRCWENQVYVYNAHQPSKLFAAPPVEDLFDIPPSVNLSSLFGCVGSTQTLFSAALSVAGMKKAPAPLTLVFENETFSPESKTIIVGCTLPPTTDDDPSAPKASSTAGGSFEFTIEENQERPQYAKQFTLEPMKGSVGAAQQIPVQITFQNASGAAVPDDSSPARPELVVSQWIQVRVTCSLKGGALWRPVPSVAGSSVAPQAAPAAAIGAAPAPVGTESDARTVHLVFRAKMQSC